MYCISKLVDILNKISDVNIWKYRQGMFVAEYWIDSGQVALAWRWRHPEADRSQGAGHLYTCWTQDIFISRSNGCSSSNNMHVIVEVIGGSSV